MTNETEVLRIEGNVTVIKGFKQVFENDFEGFLLEREVTWSGSIVPQDDESGMRLYRVEEVDGLKDQIETWKKIGKEYAEKEAKNNEAFLSLSEELAQERERVRSWKKSYEELQIFYKSAMLANCHLSDKVTEKDLVIQSLRNKETRWRTFIKWWKELWK